MVTDLSASSLLSSELLLTEFLNLLSKANYKSLKISLNGLLLWFKLLLLTELLLNILGINWNLSRYMEELVSKTCIQLPTTITSEFTANLTDMVLSSFMMPRPKLWDKPSNSYRLKTIKTKLSWSSSDNLKSCSSSSKCKTKPLVMLLLICSVSNLLYLTLTGLLTTGLLPTKISDVSTKRLSSRTKLKWNLTMLKILFSSQRNYKILSTNK